ncbi:M3 family oligoendopeptidase [Sphingomonas crusticola]|uniref:M3 family oligoendopeptidase n=1 Tax=Sphingomonas crusticola TaxID=1697973 RepID=UPI000E227FF6|nr:M3 family oligoendopeptidase [Sphingomonas crusticola]
MTELSRREAMISAAAVGALALSAGAAAADAAPAGAVWDLTDLYPNDTAWAAERNAVMARLPEITAYKGRLGEGAGTLRAMLQLQSDLALKVYRLFTYAGLKGDEDLRVAPNQERRQQAVDLFTSFGEASSWVNPELLALGAPKVQSYLAADPGLAKFRFQLEDVVRQAPHTLSPEGEALLASTAAPLAGPGDIRVQLVSSDMPRPTVTLSDGRKLRLDDQGYTLGRTAPARADRKLVFDQFWASYKSFESSLGASLASQTKGEMFQAKARKYPSALASALSGPNIPEGVYRSLVAEANKGLPVLHRYFELRRRMLSLPEIAYYDIYPPLVSLDRSFTLDEMRSLTLAAIKPLGPDYGAQFAKATANKWMDPRPRPGKQSGAYMSGSAYDVHPYLLLNLSDKYDGLTTYAHEWGHAMHTLLANKAQPFETAGYPTFTAEIASTCHELLLANYMLGQAKTKQEKLFYLGQMMENYRGTFYRQAMFAEFQLAVHDLAEKGEGLSGEKMTTVNLDLLKKYHGPKFVMDPAYGIEWAYIQHYFYGFYVFQYATSITAANYFADKVMRGTANDRENYLSVLRAGGSDYGYNILKKAGLDMATATPYQTIIRSFSDVLDQAEKLLA